jgi:hypothetical protein
VTQDKTQSNTQSEGKGNDKKGAAGVGTEAARSGGVESAKRQAEHDWENSAKESGE